MTIYEELIKRVSDGETFHIDFEKRTMKIGKQTIIKNGQYDESRQLLSNVQLGFPNIECVFRSLDEPYYYYKYSLPSKRSDNNRKRYFKALPIEKLSDKQLMVAEKREVAQAKLEGLILCMILMEQFTWDPDKFGKWFYQSPNDPDFIILRSWIENKNN